MTGNGLVGKSVLIGITCLDHAGTEVDSFQVFGQVETAGEQWIAVRRPGWSELFGLPPIPELFEPAEEGIYTLRSSGEQIKNPDFLATLTVTIADTDALLRLRGLGFVPPGE